ncbi:MAG: TIGR01212 family radical SAM protein [Clostridia bacterium]|nr:TIGR01212 family radical SAM protein [Clostridia bacterium]
MDRYYSLNRYLREQFGEKVYRLLLSGGMGCPNRDGTISNLGCTFCKSGNTEFSEAALPDIACQIQNARARIAQKTDARRFIAYFGVGSNTYAPVDRLRKLFSAAMALPEVAALSVATRADLLDENVLDLLAELNQVKPVWVEIGLQTASDATARLINRGYPTSLFREKSLALKARGITPIAHIIYSLPGETREDMLSSVRYAVESGIGGIKIHMLSILEGTPLANLYSVDPFPLLSLEEYTDLIIDTLCHLPPDLVVHRFTGDGAKRDLIAPLWTANKKQVLNYMKHAFEKADLHQGSLYPFSKEGVFHSSH